MNVQTNPTDHPYRTPPAITVHALRENKRPIGFAPWPEQPPEPKKKRKKDATRDA